ncbi:helix-turn-helix domain-containing protein [Pseudonocardia sp. WMMC193]|uniref:AraC-like ligand-binding domain-containing protein n=1 Tax=Pseudonocardia sp. WMMC193 TaxID=2911965 RepID=UPI001F00F230|nr:helix-turn-helix domain-containing protein [Pseudonocardia sp. WMMC193]MCF7550413.1 helix-turn-helix domain-containing protein [Pseudonocardia sp. WMMC193]
MTVWDTRSHPAREQFAVWHEVICQAFVPLRPTRTAAEPGFAASVETRALGGVNRARIESRPQLTDHGPREVGGSTGAYLFVNLQLAGSCRVRTAAGDAVVEPGRFVLLDTTEPYYLRFDEPWRMLSFRVPHAHLGGRPDSPALGRALDGRAGTGRVVTALMDALWGLEDTAPADLEQSFASAVGAVLGGPAPTAADLRAAVLRHVTAHLGDPGLSVASVCRRFAIAPRTLHAAFEGHPLTFAATVRELRLERCARALADPAERGTVTAIATRHGYPDPAAFSRAFRRRYGVAPRELRERHRNAAPEAKTTSG